MRKHLKNIAVAAIVLTTALSLTGCSFPGYNQRKAERLLEKKYGEKFDITAYKRPGLFGEYFSVFAFPEDNPKMVIRADVDVKGHGMSDSYVVRRVCDKISQQVTENIKDLDCEYFVYTEEWMMSTLIADKDISIEQFIEETHNPKFYIDIIIDNRGLTAKDISSAVADAIAKIPKIDGNISFYFGDDVLVSQARDYIETHDRRYAEFQYLTADAYGGYVEFENSSFHITESKINEFIDECSFSRIKEKE